MQTLGVAVGGAITSRFGASTSAVATFADRENMMFDFGVNHEQAARRRALVDSGDARLRPDEAIPYAPKAGLKEVRSTLQLTYAIRGPWQAVGVVSAGHLPDTVSESPLARKRTALSWAVGLAYGF